MKALRAYFEHKQIKDWDSRIQTYLKKLRGRDTEAYIQFYQQEVVNEAPSSELEGLISSYTHNREHASKMLASLMPIMNMLTSGALGPLLSPNNDDHDPRPITDSARIINRGQVCYIGLDSLSDSTIGSAIGSILLADLTAVAGDRYNYGVGDTRVNIFVDESSEVLNKPTVAMLNKGRGCGFSLTLATQTLADFEARLGDEAKARQVLGNLNNMVVLRVLDGETQKYIAENMPKTKVRTMEETYRSGSSSASPGEFNGMYGETIKEEDAELFPPSLLGLLPNLHFLAKFADGKTVKGRLPILQTQDAIKGEKAS
jgi:conjugal transfer pilus assembly protein TraD